LTLTAVVTSTAGVLIGAEMMLPYISVLMLGTGIVALAGIVVNHNIVLIDTFNRLRREGYSPEDASIGTMGQRMRPVLLTTYTTVLGLLPSMFKVEAHFWPARITVGGSGAEWWVQLSVAIVFGLTFSTLMILFVTPVWLLIPTYVGRFWRRRTGKPEPQETEGRLAVSDVPDEQKEFRPAAE
jgi:multidrug efflux pump